MHLPIYLFIVVIFCKKLLKPSSASSPNVMFVKHWDLTVTETTKASFVDTRYLADLTVLSRSRGSKCLGVGTMFRNFWSRKYWKELLITPLIKWAELLGCERSPVLGANGCTLRSFSLIRKSVYLEKFGTGASDFIPTVGIRNCSNVESMHIFKVSYWTCYRIVLFFFH